MVTAQIRDRTRSGTTPYGLRARPKPRDFLLNHPEPASRALSRDPPTETKGAQSKPARKASARERQPQLQQRDSRRAKPTPSATAVREQSLQKKQIVPNAKVKKDLKRDSKNFKSEILAYTAKIAATIRSVSVTEPDWRTSAQQVEELLFEFINIGYESSLIMGKTAEASGHTAASRLNNEKKQKLLDASNVFRESRSIDFDDATVFSSLVNKPKDLQMDRDKEQCWNIDLRKCLRDNEHLYQRTIMMMSIDRHCFKLLQEELDYSVELSWCSPPPPSNNPKSLWTPKPDLSIGFRTDVLTPHKRNKWLKIREPMRLHMLPELTPGGLYGRAFPFLIMEVKGGPSHVDARTAEYQSLNVAVHALHNIWQFMKGDESLEDRFFQTVRVFTASGHGEKFWVRVHRAFRSEEEDYIDGYPLSFEHQDMATAKDSHYTEENVQQLMKNIMCWGVEVLLPILQEGVKRECDNQAAAARAPSSGQQQPAQHHADSVSHATDSHSRISSSDSTEMDEHLALERSATGSKRTNSRAGSKGQKAKKKKMDKASVEARYSSAPTNTGLSQEMQSSTLSAS